MLASCAPLSDSKHEHLGACICPHHPGRRGRGCLVAAKLSYTVCLMVAFGDVSTHIPA